MDEPIILRDFLSKVEIDLLMNWLNENENLFDQHKSSIDYWNSRCIHYSSICDLDIKKHLYKIVNSMRDLIEEKFPSDKPLYVEAPQFVRWPTGCELTPHADNIEQDGITANASPWRNYGGVVYLNDEFVGGEIFYPFLNNLTIKPEPGMMVIHSADLKHTHGVHKITSGIRHTMSVFFTHNETYRIQ
jgi:hypothetical protein